MCRNPKSLDIDDDVIPIPENLYINKIHEYVRYAENPPFLQSTERKILQFVSKKGRDKYPKIVNDYKLDVTADFDRIISAFSAQKILRPLPNDFIPDRIHFQFRFSGKSTKYQEFLSNRQKIQNNLFIPYPFVRAILNLSKLEFPPMLNDYGKYTKNQNGEKTILYFCVTIGIRKLLDCWTNITNAN